MANINDINAWLEDAKKRQANWQNDTDFLQHVQNDLRVALELCTVLVQAVQREGSK